MAKPRSVRLAMLADDRAALSAMGRKGGNASARQRAIKMFEARYKLAMELEERAHQANEDVVPVDSDND